MNFLIHIFDDLSNFRFKYQEDVSNDVRERDLFDSFMIY